jgi:hypothetical protein
MDTCTKILQFNNYARSFKGQILSLSVLTLIPSLQRHSKHTVLITLTFRESYKILTQIYDMQGTQQSPWWFKDNLNLHTVLNLSPECHCLCLFGLQEAVCFSARWSRSRSTGMIMSLTQTLHAMSWNGTFPLQLPSPYQQLQSHHEKNIRQFQQRVCLSPFGRL